MRAALERRDRPLEPVAGRVLDAGVVVAAARPADPVLAIGRGLVDRRRDRAGQLVGLGAGVDGEGLEGEIVGRHGRIDRIIGVIRLDRSGRIPGTRMCYASRTHVSADRGAPMATDPTDARPPPSAVRRRPRCRAVGRLATWRYVFNTANLPEGMTTPPDAISKWLVITRAAVFSMTVDVGPHRRPARRRRRRSSTGDGHASTGAARSSRSSASSSPTPRTT